MENTIARLQQFIFRIPVQMHRYSSEELSRRPAPGKWSKKEILGHLVDSALHNWQRFIHARRQDAPLVVTPYPQDDLVRLNNYQQLPAGHIVDLWINLNRQIIAVLKILPAEEYLHPVILPDGTHTDLKWLINDYLAHLEHHVRQIFPPPIVTPVLPGNWHISVDRAIRALKDHPDGKPFIKLLEHRNMYVEIYRPEKIDRQKPHDQDEIYVVAHGSGVFYNNGERMPFKAGDLLFVPAGIEHRFEDFTDDFKTWVIFF